MIKYLETLVAFAEIPDEITLCINITNCPCNCNGCHSSYLSKDIGEELNNDVLQVFVTYSFWTRDGVSSDYSDYMEDLKSVVKSK